MVWRLAGPEPEAEALASEILPSRGCPLFPLQVPSLLFPHDLGCLGSSGELFRPLIRLLRFADLDHILCPSQPFCRRANIKALASLARLPVDKNSINLRPDFLACACSSEQACLHSACVPCAE